MAEEVLIFNIGDDSARMKVGKTYLLLGVAKSEQEARALAESLPANVGSKVTLLAKRAVIRRVPAVRLEVLDEDAAERVDPPT
ncbi:hypothetical protein [Cellulomonas sp. Leaf334]|uniref:hypothetical protein n=1 Tax=Cellulomonas sp. Leaf334 TaxID=1736339 RepID=UPI0006FC9B3D|nr:hypothetical protein [Cellulomonas sp. Leaf334]KQR16019.1 hypothetical protein ASF78_00820 [Cellulomonas sp. Leaf334]